MIFINISVVSYYYAVLSNHKDYDKCLQFANIVCGQN